MTTVTLRPNGVDENTGGVSTTGGAVNTVTSDNNDATYATLPAGDYTVITMGTTTVPAGAVVKGFTTYIRGRAVATTVNSGWRLTTKYNPGHVVIQNASMPSVNSTMQDISASTYAGPLTQTQIDGFLVWIHDQSQSLRVAEVYIDLVYATAPAVTGTAPTGVQATTTPTGQWIYQQGSDGGPQTHYEVKVYTAAQYGAGGFSPDTSTPAFTTGIVASSGNSAALGPLVNGTTYRFYVRAAQTINGSQQWSSWSFTAFSVSLSPAEVSTVVDTPNNTTASHSVVVNRNTGTHAWETIEVQKSCDAGATWEYVRGAQGVSALGNANVFTIVDYEIANGQTVIYRARASWNSGAITGSWVQSTPAKSWTSTDVWLKNPNDPTDNLTVMLLAGPDLAYARRQGVSNVLNAAMPIVRSDVLSSPTGTITLCTTTEAAATALLATLGNDVLLLQMPPIGTGSCPVGSHGFGSRYIAIGAVSESRAGQIVTKPSRVWTVPFVEVASPADPSIP